jgi:hypothetical protein
MAILAEVLGDNCGPHAEKDAHGGNQNQCRADQVYPIMEPTAHDAPLSNRSTAAPVAQAAESIPAGTRAGVSTINTKQFFYLKMQQTELICGILLHIQVQNGGSFGSNCANWG